MQTSLHICLPGEEGVMVDGEGQNEMKRSNVESSNIEKVAGRGKQIKASEQTLTTIFWIL
jgi:hypothetical protein